MRDPGRMSVLWYGERGVINATILVLARDLNLTKLFLKAIEWCDSDPPKWIDEVELVDFIVEIGLADFGNPDLIIRCAIKGETEPRLIFVEAKLVEYESSAISNNDRMTTAKFNSSINGQLSLKYRFAHALACWEGKGPIVEPDDLHACYQNKLFDPILKPRRLNKKQILEFLKEFSKLPENHCQYIAITWDKENPFRNLHSYIRPAVYEICGTDNWDQVRGRIGWIGYKTLQDIHGDLAAAISPVLKLTVATDHPIFPSSSVKPVALLTQRIEKFSPEIQRILASVEKVAQKYFGKDAQRLLGSVSVQWIRVEAKLVPYRKPNKQEVLLLGVRPTFNLSEWSEAATTPKLYNVNGETFQFIELPNGVEGAGEVADAVFQQLRGALDRHGQKL